MPKKVAESARKVVTVILPFSRTFEVDVLSFTDASTLSRVGFNSTYDVIQSNLRSKGDRYTSTFLKPQLQYCKTNELRKCKIYNNFVRGSGFFVKNTDELLISHHVLKMYLDSLRESDRNGVRLGLPILITVVDSSRNILYSHLDEGKSTIKYLANNVMSLAAGTDI